MFTLINICSRYFIIVFVLSAALMINLGSKQYKLVTNGEVRRVFKDRFYEILSFLLTIVNWPLYMLHESNSIAALEKSGIDEAILLVEEEKSFGIVAIMTIGFFLIFFYIGKLSSLAKLGYFYDWNEPAEDIVEKDDKKEEGK